MPAPSNSRVEGSGTDVLSVVNAKFEAVNVGIASRPPAPVRFSIRARTFRSALLSFKSVENTSRGKSNVGGGPEHDEVFVGDHLWTRGSPRSRAGEGVGGKREGGCGRGAADQRIDNGDAGGNEQTHVDSLPAIISIRLEIFLTNEATSE